MQIDAKHEPGIREAKDVLDKRRLVNDALKGRAAAWHQGVDSKCVLAQCIQKQLLACFDDGLPQALGRRALLTTRRRT